MFGFQFRPKKAATAQTAKERLQILLAHERADTAAQDIMPLLQRDILEVIRRHMRIDGDAVDIRMERDDDRSSLEINIELPGARALSAQVRR
ncbi:cell division topological specificity factor MinE [Rubellimicrobium mesophilum]|uniref:cell division topological specificity factor MinE n=1 Tax=Rubellimicrobium mesophilum TaxID=1123067 RepID=UPI00055F1586|nr:cell division topological specificity factor MinE [Rubellimicrobium mesophilum]